MKVRLKEVCRVEMPSIWVDKTVIEFRPTMRLKTESGNTKIGHGVIEWHSSVSGSRSRPTLSWIAKWDKNQTLISIHGIDFPDTNQIKLEGGVHRVLQKAMIKIPLDILHK